MIWLTKAGFSKVTSAESFTKELLVTSHIFPNKNQVILELRELREVIQMFYNLVGKVLIIVDALS